MMLVKFGVAENSKLRAGVERCRLIFTAQLCSGYIMLIQHIVEFEKQLSKETETIAGKEFSGFSNQIEFNDVTFQFSNKIY